MLKHKKMPKRTHSMRMYVKTIRKYSFFTYPLTNTKKFDNIVLARLCRNRHSHTVGRSINWNSLHREQIGSTYKNFFKNNFDPAKVKEVTRCPSLLVSQSSVSIY